MALATAQKAESAPPESSSPTSVTETASTWRGIPIVVANLKGGVGKSTLAVSLASALAPLARKVKFVDLDSQQSASEWVQLGQMDGHFKAIELVGQGVANTPDKDLADGLFDSWLDDCDFLIVDTPSGGTLTPTTQQAIAVTDLVLVPFEPASLAIRSTVKMWPFLREAKRKNKYLEVWVFPSKVEMNTNEHRDGIAQMKDFVEQNNDGFITFAPFSISKRTAYQTISTDGTGPESRRLTDVSRQEIEAIKIAVLRHLEVLG